MKKIFLLWILISACNAAGAQIKESQDKRIQTVNLLATYSNQNTRLYLFGKIYSMDCLNEIMQKIKYKKVIIHTDSSKVQTLVHSNEYKSIVEIKSKRNQRKLLKDLNCLDQDSLFLNKYQFLDKDH